VSASTKAQTGHEVHAPNCDCSLQDSKGVWRDVFFVDGRRGPALEVFDFERCGTRKKVYVAVRDLGAVFHRGQRKFDRLVLTYTSRDDCEDRGKVEIHFKPLQHENYVVSAGFTLMPLDEEIVDALALACKAKVKADKKRAKALQERREREERARKRDEKRAEERRAKARREREEREKQAAKKAEEARLKDDKDAKERQQRIREERRKRKKRAEKKAKAEDKSKAKAKRPSHPPRKKKDSRPSKSGSGSASGSRTQRSPMCHHQMTYEERMADQREAGLAMMARRRHANPH